MKSKSFFIVIVLVLLFKCQCINAQDFDMDVPVGWAVVPGYGLESTTGGGDGEVVTATTFEELTEYAGQTANLIIMIKDTITGPGEIEGRCNIESNKTIMGLGANATLIGVELNISDESNIIIRNLTIMNGRDGIASRRSHHVWIDHCDVSDCDDGAIDITDQADLHCVSWTRLSNHDKTMLINSGTDHDDDIGTLNTTLHHMFWDGSNQRNPRVGYGKVHVLNCLYRNNGSYGIGLHSQGFVYAESNYFDNPKHPIHQMYRMDPGSKYHGYCESVNNIFVGDYSADDIDDEGISFRVNDYYLYDFVVDDVDSVPSVVEAGVGPAEQYASLGLLPTPGNGAIIDSVNSATLTWTKCKTATSYAVSFGTTKTPPVVATVDTQMYSVDGLQEGIDYYWKVDQNTPDGTIEGKLWMFRTAGDVPGQPTTEITYPGDSIIIDAEASVIVTADATDSDGSVVSVEFIEGKTSLGTDSTAPYEITWTGATEGTHMLKSKVTDNDGNTYVSDVQFVYVRYHIPGLSDEYELCSDEGEECSSSKVVNVAFGADGEYTYIYSTSGSVGCDAETFGAEAGSGRSCYITETPYPYVAFVYPTSDKTIDEGGKVTFRVKVKDNEEVPDSVEFMQNNVSIGKSQVASSGIAKIIWQDIPAGEYRITASATDGDGNTTVSDSIHVSAKSLVSISEVNENKVELYPNPTSSTCNLRLQCNSSTISSLKLINSNGSTVFSDEMIGSHYVMDMQVLPKGIYYVIIINRNEQIVKKVVKK